MHQMKYLRLFSKGEILLTILIIGGFLWSGTGTPAFADTPGVNGTVIGGSVVETAPASYTFTSWQPGTTTTFTMPFSVSDTTGGAVGWNITISATQFSCCSAAHFLPTTATSIAAAPPGPATTAVCTAGGAAGVNCMQASLTNTVTAAVPITTSPTKFFGIAAASASGVYTITPTINVVIPAVTFLGTYASTFTLTSNSGP